MGRYAPLLVLLAAATAHAAPEPFAWETDLPAARKRADRENKPLVVLFRCVP